MRESPLARILFAVYVALVVYASLYPLAGWRDHGLPLLAYLSAPWPRFVTGFDVAANLLGYVPYGFLCVAALYPRVQGGAALGIATLSGLALSLIALWLFTQLNPATLLFATGDLRDIVAPHETRAHAPVFFAAIEAFAAG